MSDRDQPPRPEPRRAAQRSRQVPGKRTLTAALRRQVAPPARGVAIGDELQRRLEGALGIELTHPVGGDGSGQPDDE